MEKVRFLLSLLLVTICLSAMAQEESPSKRINAIKRNSSYIYAEATAATENEAYETANLLLTKYISEYIVSKKNLKQADNVLVKDKVSHCEKISMQRGSMYRVFVYVKNSDIMPVDNVEVITQQEAEANAPKVVEKKELQSKVEEIAQQESTATTTQEQSAATDLVLDSSLPEWQQAALNDFASKTNVHEVNVAISKLKAQYKIKRSGDKTRRCPRPEESCYIVFDDSGNIMAILSAPQNGVRTDYMSGNAHSLEEYSGNDYLWFTFSK